MNISMTLRLILMIINPPGGIGKTHFTQVVEAIAKLLLRDLYLISQDRGNHAIKDAIKEARVIPSDEGPQGATRIISAVADREICIIDVGANPASDNYSPLPFAAEMSRQMLARGGRFIAVVPAAPLKLGGDRTTMNTVASLLNEEIETHVVKNHQNLSGEFGRLELPGNVPVSDVPYLEPGLVALLRQRKGSFLDAYTNPEPGFELAGHRIGDYLARASDSPLMQTIFEHSGPAFKLKPDQQPPALLGSINTSTSVKNEALQKNAAMKSAHDAMLRAVCDETLLVAAKTYVAFYR